MAVNYANLPIQKGLLDPMEVLSCFPQVQGKILAALCVKDLIACTEVCRGWRQHASKALSKRRNYARIHECCEDILKFSECIKSSKFCAMNGLIINIPEEHYCLKRIRESSVKFLCTNLQQLNLRYLHLYVAPCRPAQIIMSTVAFQAARCVEELSITFMGGGVINKADLFDMPIPTSFPKLKILTVKHSGFLPTEILEIVQKSPNLQKISALVSLDDLRKMDPKHMKLLSGIKCQPLTDHTSALVTVVSINPKLTDLQFFDFEDTAFDPAWFNHLRSLLTSSASTLARLSVCASKFCQFVNATDLILQNLACLDLYFPLWANNEEFWKIVMAMRLRICCPSLFTVRIDFKGYCSHEIDAAALSEPETYASVLSVNEVILAEPPCTLSLIENAIEMFPRLSSFAFEWLSCMDVCDTASIEHASQMHILWSELPLLERLKICIVGAARSPTGLSLDALFCGITEGERKVIKTHAEIKNMDLCHCQLCPTRPSLVYASSLKELCLVYAPSKTLDVFTVSAVSGHLAFARMPSLRVKILSYGQSDAKRPTHLEPFAEVIYFFGLYDWW